VKGRDADYQDAFDFILPGAGNHLRVAAYSLIVSMGMVLMAYRDDVSGRFARRVTDVRWKRVCGNGSVIMAACLPLMRKQEWPNQLISILPNISQTSVMVNIA
jgi:hypothetical protein